MKKQIRNQINKTNAKNSTGPTTEAGKQRASMNAVKHGLTGNRIVLQQHEMDAYKRLTLQLNKELQPKTELETQLVQKIIDCHTRLNRIAALEGNILNIGLIQNETDADHDDATDSIVAQCRSWIENADSFEKLGRYEARIQRQLLQYTKELERLQGNRFYRASWPADWMKPSEPAEDDDSEPVNPESASFGEDTLKVLPQPVHEPVPNLRQ